MTQWDLNSLRLHAVTLQRDHRDTTAFSPANMQVDKEVEHNSSNQ